NRDRGSARIADRRAGNGVSLQEKLSVPPEAPMFTATADLILPSTTTGSFPRPRWYDVSMWGRPLDTCMLDIRFREKFQDAMAVVISDQERAGLDILTHGDLHVDEDMAGRARHQ